jgi:hypothetical protein
MWGRKRSARRPGGSGITALVSASSVQAGHYEAVTQPLPIHQHRFRAIQMNHFRIFERQADGLPDGYPFKGIKSEAVWCS